MRQSKKHKWESIKYVDITIYKTFQEVKYNKEQSIKFIDNQPKNTPLEHENINSCENKYSPCKNTVIPINITTNSPIFKTDLEKINIEIKLNTPLTETEQAIRNLAERDTETNYKCKEEPDSDSLKFSLENTTFPSSDDLLDSSSFHSQVDLAHVQVSLEDTLMSDLQKRGFLVDSSSEIQKKVNSYLNSTLEKNKEQNKIRDLQTNEPNSSNIDSITSPEYNEYTNIKHSADTHEILEYFPLTNMNIKTDKEDLRSNKKFSSALLIAKSSKPPVLDNLQLVSHLHKISQKTLIKKDETRNIFIKKNVVVEEYSKTDSGDCFDCEEADKYFEEGE